MRDGALLPAALTASAAYVRDAAPGDDEVNFADRGIALTRRFGARKLWLSLKVHGRIALRLCIDNPRTTVEDVESTMARLGALATDAAVV